MVRKSLLTVGLSAAIASLSICTVSICTTAQAVNAATSSDSPDLDATPSVTAPIAQPVQVAQLFYPPATDDHQVLMVVGHGKISRPADKASVQLIVLSYDISTFNPYPVSDPAASGAELPEPPPIPPLTEEILKPFVAALVAAGVPASDITVEMGDVPGASPYNYYGEGSAAIAFDLAEPTSDRVEEIMAAAQEATSDKLYLQDRYIGYVTNSCDDMEAQAYIAAVADARDRAQILATAMQVEMSQISSVAEMPVTLGSTPYPSPCDLENLPQAAAYGYSTLSYYDPSAPVEVTLQRDLYVTYPVRQR
ncbi:MAG: SIMPL domain-containing protein [Drouetiella hepatica Uher 2000/2452]|jgi:uncharacterized protein YggE|uniref:SIMPL domain-containing protein n=1 Tax=Drouetiella hepatica Uher 2000/2452 TaxID=904376 RepID=A0A951UNA1_9CYAN|nr:SIMPL domain-containing protein [Drouetiella hepatica Uher 2000/2452]